MSKGEGSPCLQIFLLQHFLFLYVTLIQAVSVLCCPRLLLSEMFAAGELFEMGNGLRVKEDGG